MNAEPLLLDAARIAALIPHSGSMCLLDGLLAWDRATIACRASNHRHLDHPLRSRRGLLVTSTIEYAAQAMALHGALIGQEAGSAASPGFLASARGVRFHALRLDDLPLPESPWADSLRIEARRQAGDARQLLYAFTVHHAGRPLAEGRLTVVLNTALAA
ncbi:MAG: hydroxymyristoyl-ACP dehydratase [Pseudomonadota bacterium]|nr:hydroxymyristoyl-ACP dehydratase [Pseudomonadota bacterium]